MPSLKHVDFEVPGFGELAAAPVTVPSYRDAVMALNPLAYWRLGEQSGTTLVDEAASHPLLLDGAFTLAQSGAIHNDSNGSILLAGGTAQSTGSILPPASNAPFSILFWARIPSGPIQNGAFAGQYTGTISGEVRLHLIANGTLRYSTLNQMNLFTSGVIDTAWRQVVLTRSVPGVTSWYLDGVLDASLTGGGAAIPPAPFAFGTIASANPALLLDELAIFDEALSAEQVRWLNGLGRAVLASPTQL